MKTRETKIREIENIGFFPRKSLGQNFLLDENALLFIKDSLEMTGNELVIEIGAGTGELSVILARECKHLALIEIDSNLIPVLKEKTGDVCSVEIIEADALKFDLTSYHPFQKLVFTVQKEAGERIVSGSHSKEYGVLPVIANCFYSCEIIKILSGDVFYPSPNVDSCVLTMTPRTDILPEEGEIFKFSKFVKAAFSQRRKKISNSISSYGGLPDMKEKMEKILIQKGFSSSSRAQELSPVDLWDIFRIISSEKQEI